MMLKPASETGTMFADPKASMEDRKQFVENLGWLMAQTREGILAAYLDDREIVHIVRRRGKELLVNVEANSYMAIIRDVANALR